MDGVKTYKNEKSLLAHGISKTKKGTSTEKNAHEKLDYLLFSFVNHGGHSDRTIEDDRLNAAISYSINNAKLLKNYRPMKRRKFSSSRIRNFKKLISVVKEELAQIRKWFVENTVSHHLVRYFTNTQLILCVQCLSIRITFRVNANLSSHLDMMCGMARERRLTD